MQGCVLLTLSLTACLLLLVAMITPGWIGLEIDNKSNVEETEVTITMSIFYSRACVEKKNQYSNTIDICVTMSNAEAVNKHASTTSMSPSDFRFTEFMVEASLALVCVSVGTVLTVIYALSVIKRERSNHPYPASASSGLSATALVFIIIGGICGGIVCIEFIIAHVRVNDALDQAGSYGLEMPPMKKYFPYSILMMAFGLFFEFLAVIIHIASMRTTARSGAEIILTPAVNSPTVVVQSSSATSSVPYSKFA